MPTGLHTSQLDSLSVQGGTRTGPGPSQAPCAVPPADGGQGEGTRGTEAPAVGSVALSSGGRARFRKGQQELSVAASGASSRERGDGASLTLARKAA